MIESSLGALLVLAALAAVPLLLRRHRAQSPDGIRVVGRTALNKTSVVAVLAIGERRLLVGAGDKGVELLAELDPTSERADLEVARGTDRRGHPLSSTTTTTSIDLDGVAAATPSADGRTDVPAAPLDVTASQDVLADLDVPSASTHAGPGIGLVDRLREMTVRTPVTGRPFHDLLRR